MKQGLIYFTDIHLPVVGFLIFFLWFLLMLYWVYRVVPKEQHLLMSKLPLRNEEAGCEPRR